MKSEFAQPMSFPVASITTPLNVQNLNAQFDFDFRTQHASENQRLILNAYSSHHEWSDPSPITSAIPYPTAGLASMIPIPGPSFHVRRGSVASLAAASSFPLPSSPILDDHFVSISPVHPGLAPPAAPSQIADHALPHQDTSGSLGAPLAPREEPRTGKRKCSAPTNQLISSAATPYHECSGSSSATLTAAEPARMVPGPSSHMRHSSVASPHTVRYLSSTCSSGPQSDVFLNNLKAHRQWIQRRRRVGAGTESASARMILWTRSRPKDLEYGGKKTTITKRSFMNCSFLRPGAQWRRKIASLLVRPIPCGLLR
jgi:hypothetical protein